MADLSLGGAFALGALLGTVCTLVVVRIVVTMFRDR